GRPAPDTIGWSCRWTAAPRRTRAPRPRRWDRSARSGARPPLRSPPTPAPRGRPRAWPQQARRRTHAAMRVGRASDHHSELLTEADIAFGHVAHVLDVAAEHERPL